MRAKTLKKAACVILAAVMLTGCSSNNSGGAGVGGAGVENGSQDSENSEGKIAAKETEVTVLLPDSATQPLKNYAPAQQEIFNKTNIKLDYQIVPASSYEDKKSVSLATNNFPDIVYVTQNDLTTYGTTGIFEPLMQYVNEEDMPNFYKFWKEYPEMEKFCVDGELYAFPVIQRDETANGVGPVIRMDLLEKHNIKIPGTFAELLDALEQLKEIYPNSIPWTGRKGTNQLLKTAAYMLGSGYSASSNGSGLYYDYDVNGGSYVFGPATEEFKAVLSFFNEAYERGILDPDFATTTAEQFESKLSSGKSFFYVDNSGFAMNYTKTLRETTDDKDAKMMLLPIPENSFGQRRAISYAQVFPGRNYAINAGSKNIKEIIKFIDWMYSKEGSDISNYGVEGYSFDYNTEGEPEYKLEYLEQFRDASPSSYYAVYSDLGVTKLNFSLWACNTRTWFEIEKALGNWDEVSDEYWSIVEADDAYQDNYMDPPLTTEQSERVKEITIDLNTMLEQEYNKYIMGLEPIENWDNVIEKAKKLGVDELVEIYNEANAAYK